MKKPQDPQFFEYVAAALVLAFSVVMIVVTL